MKKLIVNLALFINKLNFLNLIFRKVEQMKLRAKHEVMTIEQISKIKEPVPVHVFNTKVPTTKTNWGVYGPYMLSEQIVIIKTEIQATTPKMCYFTYRVKGSIVNKNAVVPMDFQVAKLTGLQGKILMNDYNENIKLNFGQFLRRPNDRIGSDPEVFVTDEENNLIPAYTFLKAKNDPTRDMTARNDNDVKSKGVYWDGFQAEFETHDSYCLAWHTDSVHEGLKALLKAARRLNDKAKLSIKTVMEIPEMLLQTAEEKYVQLGCMPSLNVYGSKGEPVPDGRVMPTRSTGGHIHFGLNQGNKDTKIPEMIKALDAILGVACVALFAKYDNPERRRYYGLAGEYRLPEHGFEYRTLSNAWLVHPFIMNIVFDVARMAAAVGKQDYLHLWKATEQETIDCINQCDVAKAQEILNRNKAMFIQVLGAAYPSMRYLEGHLEKLFEIFRDGMDKVIETNDIEKNWNLTNGIWISHSDGADKNCSNGLSKIINNKKLA